MAKLTTLKPRLTTLASRLSVPAYSEPAQRVRQRDESLAYRKWYKTSRWQKLRMVVLIRDLFQCRMCKRIESKTSLLVCDHVKPHRGNELLFWDEANLQCLCKSCHDGLKQKQEQASLHMRGRWD